MQDQNNDYLVRSSREKLAKLKKEYKTRHKLEEDAKIRILPIKRLIAVIVWSLLVFSAVSSLNFFLYWFVPELILVFFMLYKLLDRKRRRDDAREALRSSRPLSVIKAEIAENQKIVESAKNIFGYRKDYSESDYIAVLKWILYAKPSTAEIFNCWPFNIFDSFYSAYSKGLDYMSLIDTHKKRVQLKLLTGEDPFFDAVSIMDNILKELMYDRTKYKKPAQENIWYSEMILSIGTLICLELYQSYKNMIKKHLSANDSLLKDDSHIIQESAKDDADILLKQANTLKRKEFSDLLTQFAHSFYVHL